MPLLIKEIIVEELGFGERLFLSFTSKRTCSLVKLFRNEPSGFISITIDINNSELSVCVRKPHLSEPIPVKIRSRAINKLEFRIPYEQGYVKDSSAWIIDGSTVQAEKYSSAIYCSLNDERFGLDKNRNAVIVFGKLLRHLNSVLNIQECRECKYFMRLPVGLFRQLDCSYSYGRIETQTGYIANTSPEDLTFLLDHIKANHIILNVAVTSAPGYKYRKNPEKKRSIDVLKVAHYSWVDFSNLPAARVISILIEIPLNQMRTILVYWIAGRNREMEIGFFRMDELTDQDREALFSGIKTQDTQLTGAEIRSFIVSTKDIHKMRFPSSTVAVDVVRKSDGMRATVIEGDKRNMRVYHCSPGSYLNMSPSYTS
ncbi:hypothetical protein B9Z55_003298 [Caenorhabditis nigoni]|nr:hypothetical protein B9Z55_003298 [Caenorhabditis nigoni]